MKTLTWHYGGLLHAGTHDVRTRRGGAAEYRLPADYYPDEVRLTIEDEPSKDAVVVDVRDDGASIFTYYPQVDADTSYKTQRVFNETGRVKMAKGSVVTMHIVSVSGKGDAGAALTVELDMVEVAE